MTLCRIRNFARIYIIIAVSFSVLIYLTRKHFISRSKLAIVVKLPRSGSSWFTQLLNEKDYVFLSKEIIQSEAAKIFSITEKEKHLARSLKYPAGKISHISNFFPSGRYTEDFLLHKSFKVFKVMKVLGFTLNIEHCIGVDWLKILPRDNSDAKIIIYGRSNVVKSTISGYRGVEMRRLCGLSNLRESSNNCNISSKVDITPRQLLHDVYQWQLRIDNMQEYVSQTEGLRSLPSMHVYYEELQADPTRTLNRVLTFLAMEEENSARTEVDINNKISNKITSTIAATPNPTSFEHSNYVRNISKYNSSKKKDKNRWVKRSPEDVRMLLYNDTYNTLDADLTTGAAKDDIGCVAIHRQLNEKGFVMHNKVISDANPDSSSSSDMGGKKKRLLTAEDIKLCMQILNYL